MSSQFQWLVRIVDYLKTLRTSCGGSPAERPVRGVGVLNVATQVRESNFLVALTFHEP